jgi:hypothetical protein
MKDIYNRYPKSSCVQREPTTNAYSYPGPNGAESTLRLEAFREGIQEAEALIILSEASDKYAKEVGAELAEKCKNLVHESLVYCSANMRTINHGLSFLQFNTNHYGWQDLTTRIFETAGEVNRVLEKKK